jgi:mRNA-degrading endonuclease RelE of RelBE toxin-antitoxin system
MAFHIAFSEDAERQMAALRAVDRTRIFDEIEEHLTHEPDKRTRRRKKLTDHPLADWELRVDDWRVLYDVDSENHEVAIIVVGQKVRHKLMIEGKEFKA